jgi:hypothetical protein
MADPFLADLSGKQRAKSVPPKSNRLIADVDAAFVQKILDVPKRQRETDIHHHGQTDDLGARLEVEKKAAFCHPETLIAHPAASTDFALTVPRCGLFKGTQKANSDRCCASTKVAPMRRMWSSNPKGGKLPAPVEHGWRRYLAL